MLVLGVDACPGGWVGVTLDAGRFDRAVLAADLDSILTAVPDAAVVAVDIPIGLLNTGWRTADQLARRRLGARGSTVFATPPRPVLTAPDYEEAAARCRQLTGQGLSRQAWGLTARTLEADRLRPRLGDRLREVHPELSFVELAGGPLPSKRTWTGVARRTGLLRAVGIELPAELGTAGLRAAPDDVLDAAAAAWSATRVAAGQACSLPDPPEAAPDGWPVAIWY